MQEKLLRCWNCNNIINIPACEPCEHKDGTMKCPYCGKCLCDNPKFKELKRIEDEDGWHVGDIYIAVTEKEMKESVDLMNRANECINGLLRED